MIILDVDSADKGLRALLQKHHPVPGVWGYKIGDEVLKHGVYGSLCPYGDLYNMMVDLKHHDVLGRLRRIVELYSGIGKYAPKFLTISGERPIEAIAAAVEARGTIDIVVTGPLSDEKLSKQEASEKVMQVMSKAIKARAQGITCPAWILSSIDTALKHTLWKDYYTIATGVVSEGVNPRHHFNPRPLEFALKYGATHVVVGTEVIESQDPIGTLSSLGALCTNRLLQLS